MHTILQDIRYGLRLLRKNPGFTAVALAALAVGIGANTAMFSVLHAALTRSVPFRDADRLVAVPMSKQGGRVTMECSYPSFLDWQRAATSFEQLAGYGNTSVLLHRREGTERVRASRVSSNFFALLGVEPVVGRTFMQGDETAHGDSVVLTYAAWKKYFGGDTGIVGRAITLGSTGRVVVGVLPAGFTFAPAQGAEIYMLVPQSGDQFSRRNLHWFNVIGRLKAGISRQQAQAEMTAISQRLAEQYPQSNNDISALVSPLEEVVVGPVRPVLLVLMAAVGVVLLIACVNVANLLLARAVGRQREIAVRTALGAPRGRIARQLVTEALLLSFSGGLLALLLARWCTDLLIYAIPDAILTTMPYLREIPLDGSTFAFTFAVALASGILFGTAPAWRLSSVAPNESLKDGGWSGPGRNRFGLALVGFEVALSVVLLIGSGLLLKSLQSMLRVDPGFNTANLLTFSVFLPPTQYNDDPVNIAAESELRSRLRALPGVIAVGATTSVPLNSGDGTVRMVREGAQPRSVGDQTEAAVRGVSADYFDALGATMLRGRKFTEGDRLKSKPVTIVNRSLARLLFGTDDVVGRRLRLTFSPDQPFQEIVGVVNDINEQALDAGPGPAIYFPYEQSTSIAISYVLRTSGDPESLAGSVRQAVHGFDPSIAVYNIASMDTAIGQSQSTFLRKYPALMLSVFTGIALLLAMLGLYGVVNYSVSQRTREIGVRVALGARRGDVLRLFLGQGALLVLSGSFAGIAGALVIAKVASGLLFGVRPHDLQVFALAPALLAVVAMVAVAIPARRASKVDPMVALRYE